MLKQVFELAINLSTTVENQHQFPILAPMPLFIASLNSGSNGNCYYIGNDKEAILVDAGLSLRETEIRLKRLGIPPAKIKALFISHEHTDHIKGVQMLSKKWSLPVFINSQTLLFSRLKLEKHLVNDLNYHTTINIGSLEIVAFPKKHDAADACSFIVSGENATVGVFTDIGRVCNTVKENFKKCTAAFLESNYDDEMLENGNYPIHLKNRIRGGKGHLSNKEALDLFLQQRSPLLSHLVLSHLSENNNCPGLVEELFSKHAGTTKVKVASRYKESEILQVNCYPSSISANRPPARVAQLQLFAD